MSRQASIENQINRALKGIIDKNQLVTVKEVGVIVRGILATAIGTIPTGRGRPKKAAASAKSERAPKKAAATKAPKKTVEATQRKERKVRSDETTDQTKVREANNEKMRIYRAKQKVLEEIRKHEADFKPARGASLEVLSAKLATFTSPGTPASPTTQVASPSTRKILDKPPAPTIVANISPDT